MEMSGHNAQPQKKKNKALSAQTLYQLPTENAQKKRKKSRFCSGPVKVAFNRQVQVGRITVIHEARCY